MLRRHMAVAIDGVDAFARWADGGAAAARAVRDLLSALGEAFVIPIESEDLFALSRGIDRILNYVADLVKESEVMASPPDAGMPRWPACSATRCACSTTRCQSSGPTVTKRPRS